MISFNAYELTALELALRIARKHMRTPSGREYMNSLHHRVHLQVVTNANYDGRLHEPPALIDELK